MNKPGLYNQTTIDIYCAKEYWTKLTCRCLCHYKNAFNVCSEKSSGNLNSTAALGKTHAMRMQRI